MLKKTAPLARTIAWSVAAVSIAFFQFPAAHGAGTNSTIAAVMFLLGAVAVYLAPAIVALSREHKNKGAIFILNLLLGWTLLGWIGALIWSFTNNTAPPYKSVPGPGSIPKPSTPLAPPSRAISVADEIVKLAQLRDAGTITEAEFQLQKSKLLSR